MEFAIRVRLGWLCNIECNLVRCTRQSFIFFKKRSNHFFFSLKLVLKPGDFSFSFIGIQKRCVLSAVFWCEMSIDGVLFVLRKFMSAQQTQWFSFILNHKIIIFPLWIEFTCDGFWLWLLTFLCGRRWLTVVIRIWICWSTINSFTFFRYSHELVHCTVCTDATIQIKWAIICKIVWSIACNTAHRLRFCFRQHFLFEHALDMHIVIEQNLTIQNADTLRVITNGNERQREAR